MKATTVNIRGWFSHYNKIKIHYYSNNRALCHKNLTLEKNLKPAILKPNDDRPCKMCTNVLKSWSDLDNFDSYYSD